MKHHFLLDVMAVYMKAFPSVLPEYSYENETSMNPAYCDSDHCEPLCTGEKRIWVLRTDFTLAVGIKNTNLSSGNTSLLSKTDKAVHQYINLNDRYGHPSLAHPENDYDGSVYYAGWLHQHPDRLEVFLCSGRYHNRDLHALQKKIVEYYVFLKMNNAYRAQHITFTDWCANEELDYFLQGRSTLLKQPKRTYSEKNIALHGMLMVFLFAALNPSLCHDVYILSIKAVRSYLMETLQTLSQLAAMTMLRLIVSLLIKKDHVFLLDAFDSASSHADLAVKPINQHRSLFFSPPPHRSCDDSEKQSLADSNPPFQVG